MEGLFEECQVMLGRTSYDLELMRGAANENIELNAYNEIMRQLKRTDETCQRLKIMVAKELPHRRKFISYKVNDLEFECKALSNRAMTLHAQLVNKWRAAAEREELLTQRFQPNDFTPITFEDSEFHLNDRLHASHGAMDEMINHGSAILEQIRMQGMNFHSIKRKVYDIGQQLGLSSTTLRMIERRVSKDWIIFCIGCFFVLIFLFVFYRFWKG